MNGRWVVMHGGLVAGTLGLLLISGCMGGSESCEYWVHTLEKGKKEKSAIQKVGELGCVEAVDALKERFDKGSLYRREILAAIKALSQQEGFGEKERAVAINVVRDSLPDKEVGPLAIQLAIEWKVDSIKTDLSKLIRRQRSASSRLQALEALTELITPPTLEYGEGDNGKLHFEGEAGRPITNVSIQFVDKADPAFKEKLDGVSIDRNLVFVKADFAGGVTAKAVADLLNQHHEAGHTVAVTPSGDGSGKVAAMERPKTLNRVITDITLIKTLNWVVGQEPTLQGVDTNQYAADRLAEVDWKNVKDAELVNSAAQNLVKALFMRDAKNNSAQINARLALRVVGPPAVDPILTAFQGVNKELNEFAEIRGLPRWKYTQGHELVEMLWDVGDRRASPALMKAIGIPLDPPPADVARLPEEERIEWKTANQNRLTTTALTVGALPNDDAVPYAVELLAKKDPPPDATQFVQAGLGLALMGTNASRAALWKLFKEGGNVTELTEKIATLKAAVEKEGNAEKKRAMMKEHDALIDQKAVILDTRANYVTNLAVGLSARELPDFKSMVMDQEKGPLKDSAQQPLPRAYYNVVAECKKDLKCYATKLESLKGKMDVVPGAIMAAQQKMGTEKKRIAEKAKPITEKIKAARKAFKEHRKAIMEFRKTIQEIDDLKDKAQRNKRNDERNELVEKFNKGIEEDDAMRKAMDALYDERNKVIDEIEPFRKAFEGEMEKIHTLEKVALMLGVLDGGDQYVPMLADVFIEAKHPMYTQFRQWSLITLEHVANKSHLAPLEKVLRSEQGEDGKKTTFWSLRLDSLISRVKRS